MAATTKNWLNNNPPQCEDVDLNGFKNENNNLIIGSGQALSIGDNQQTHKAVAHYAASGDFYTDSGSATAYVLTAVGAHVAPPTYHAGMRIRFVAGNTNTGAATVNVATLGVVNLNLQGAALTAGDIVAGETIVAEYNTTGPAFDIIARENINNRYVRTDGAATQSIDGLKTFTDKVSALITRTSGSNADAIDLKDTTSSPQLAGFGLRLNYYSNGMAVQAAIGLENGGTGTNNESQISFYTQNVFATLVRQLLIQSNGIADFTQPPTVGGAGIWYAGNLAASTRGALVYATTSQSIPNTTVTALNFNAEVEDTDSIHDTVTNNSRLTVPSGVSRVRVHGRISWGSSTTGTRNGLIYKNGAIFLGMGRGVHEAPSVAGQVEYAVASAVINVSPGDYFELMAFQSSGVSQSVLATDTLSNAATWFALEIIK